MIEDKLQKEKVFKIMAKRNPNFYEVCVKKNCNSFEIYEVSPVTLMYCCTEHGYKGMVAI